MYLLYNNLSTDEFIREIFLKTRNWNLKPTAKIFSNMGELYGMEISIRLFNEPRQQITK